MANVIRCDGCQEYGSMDHDPGWIRWQPISRVYRVGVDNPDAKDYCPACAARMQAALRATSDTQRLSPSAENTP